MGLHAVTFGREGSGGVHWHDDLMHSIFFKQVLTSIRHFFLLPEIEDKCKVTVKKLLMLQHFQNCLSVADLCKTLESSSTVVLWFEFNARVLGSQVPVSISKRYQKV